MTSDPNTETSSEVPSRTGVETPSATPAQPPAETTIETTPESMPDLARPRPALDVAALQGVLQQLAEAIKAERSHAERLFRQSEALASLLAWLQPSMPFPPTRGWAASPDFLMLETEAIIEVAGRTGGESIHVVEASSGVTTLVAAYALKRLGIAPGVGRVTSLEHDLKYVSANRELLARHGLADYATVVHAPLEMQELDGMSFKWYAAAALESIDAVDVLVVDGPPGRLGPIARFPALPRLADRLSSGAIVLADDADRPGEAEMVRRWASAFPEATCEMIDAEKGAARLRFP